MTTTSDHHLVRVTWIDAHAVTDTWTAIDELDDEPCVVTSVGLLLRDAKPGHVVIAQSHIAEQDDVDGVLAIPSSMVTRMEDLCVHPLFPVEPDDPF